MTVSGVDCSTVQDMQHKHPIGFRAVLPPFFACLQAFALDHANTMCVYLLSEADVDGDEYVHTLVPATSSSVTHAALAFS